MKQFLLLILLFYFNAVTAQKIDSIYVDLYTDSLKRGTANYINIDGRLQNGNYLPLDSTHIIFYASAGNFIGNCLWIDKDFTGDKVNVKVVLKKNLAVFKQFDIYIKKNPDNEQLKTVDQIMGEIKKSGRSRKKT